MNQIYKKKHFIIFRVKDGFIVHNTKKPFYRGHTHISNLNTAKYIINLSINKNMPHHLSKYLIVSLIRLATDQRYIHRLNGLLEQKRKPKKNCENRR